MADFIDISSREIEVSTPKPLEIELEVTLNLPAAVNMATLADELLNDFEDSGSEGEQNALEESTDANAPTDSNYPAEKRAAALEKFSPHAQLGMGDDEDGADDAVETNIDRLELKGVNDVRSVAKLMQTLQPVLEVSCLLTTYTCVS